MVFAFVCETSYDTSGAGSGCGTQGAPLIQNVQSNIVDNGNIGNIFGVYWTSTEYSVNPTQVAWAQLFASGGGATQATDDKFNQHGIRCGRIIVP